VTRKPASVAWGWMMRNLWKIAKHEYRRTVVRRGFILMTAAVPLGMMALIALVILVEGMGVDDRPLGFVDHSGTVDAALYASLPEGGDRVQILSFPDEETAQAALEAEEIQAFFVLPADYPQTLQTDLYYLEEPPSDGAWRDFDDLVRISLLAGMPGEMQQRLLRGPEITVQDVVSNRSFSESSIVNIILPFVATFIFFFATMFAAGYMLSVVAGEKENRTIEIMVTSVTAGQLIGGKTLGLLGAALTQLGLYLVALIVGVLVAAPYVPELQQLVVPWDYVGVIALFFLTTYALVAAVMIAIGGAVTEIQQGQQLAGILNLFFLAPIFLLPVLLEDPGHPLMIFLTLFPTTSFLTVSLRWGLGTVPMWQIGVSWLILAATTGFMVWAAARIFRAGMLRYGQALNFKSAIAAVRRR
jgi:ABC-2 type transport system permease protein